jgi:hypothetical protein
MNKNETILAILNNGGAHLPTAREFRMMAEAKWGEGLSNAEYKSSAFSIGARFEELTRGKWVKQPVFKPVLVDGYGLAYDATQQQLVFQHARLLKKHVVCEMEKPIEPNKQDYPEFEYNTCFVIDLEEYETKRKAYEAAQQQVWFSGFDKVDGIFVKQDEEKYLMFGEVVGLKLGNYTATPIQSVYDFIYHVSFANSHPYHRKTPLLFTLNFVNALCQ